MLAFISFCTSAISAGSSATPTVTLSSSFFCAGAISVLDIFPEVPDPEEAELEAVAPLVSKEADTFFPAGDTFTSSNVSPVPAF